MAQKNLVTIDPKSVKKFTLETKKTNQEFRKSIFTVLSLSLDHIRHVAADKYILPNTVGKRMSPWAMAKKQPPHPTKLTERTGRLLQMMRHDKKWEGIRNTLLQTKATVTQQTMGIKGRIVAVAQGRNINETYEATLRANIADSNPLIGKGFCGGGRILAIENGKIIRAEKRETKQTLHARFLHEHGIRGFKRQSFTPATIDENFRLEKIFNDRLNRILSVRSKYGFS